MYHSITIGLKNTWDDWKLVPASRPVINPPEPRYNFIDIPGMDGKLDASVALTGEVTYQNRTGSIDFYVMNGYKEWQHRYSEIMNYLHGKEFNVILEDDPMWYYTGRVKVNQWASEKDRSRITLDYDLYPYKTELLTSVDDWIWDVFDFEVGVIREYRDIVVEKDLVTKITLIGSRKTSIPIFSVKLENEEEGISMTWRDPETGNIKTAGLISGDEIRLPDFKIKDYEYEIELRGAGVVSISYQGGSL